MRDFPGLSQQFDRKYGERLPACGGHKLEGGKASSVAAVEFVPQHRQSVTGQNDRKGLYEAIDRGQCDGQTGDARVMNQIAEEGGRQKRQVDGQKYRVQYPWC